MEKAQICLFSLSFKNKDNYELKLYQILIKEYFPLFICYWLIYTFYKLGEIQYQA